MKKLLALVLAAMMLCVTFGALAEYPAVVEGIDLEEWDEGKVSFEIVELN